MGDANLRLTAAFLRLWDDTVKSFDIPGNGCLGVYQGSPRAGLPMGAYTAVIESTLPLAAIVNKVAPSGGGSARQSTSYNAVAAGSSMLHLPLVENAGPIRRTRAR